MRSAFRLLVAFTIVAVIIIEGAAWLHRHRSDLPWTELDLSQAPGRFTASKIAELGSDPPRCRALLRAAGNPATAAPSRSDGPDCGYQDGTLIAGLAATPAPSGLVTSCPVAAGLLVWERALQLEAQRTLKTRVSRVLHAGSYSCRRLYNRPEGSWSEHATADAVDIIGFQLADGRTLSVLRDWSGEGPEANFLRKARDLACRSFATVLSPDYNEAHRDHLHLDTADRGRGGWSACR